MEANDTVRGALAELRHTLLLAVKDPNQQVYAIFDGAQFEDVTADLVAAELFPRSLYINVKDRSLLDAGPWLVDFTQDAVPASIAESVSAFGGATAEEMLSDRALAIRAYRLAAMLNDGAGAGDYAARGALSDKALSTSSRPAEGVERRIEAVFRLLSARPSAAVFWIGNASLTEERLWKHARSINRVLIPKAFASTDDDGAYDETYALPDREGANSSNDFEAVLFRHFDGNVLGEILPHLSPEQLKRLFGPADAALFLAPDYPSRRTGSALLRARRPLHASALPAGLLLLTAEQMEALEEDRLREIHRDALLDLVATYDEVPSEAVRKRMWEDGWEYILEADSVGVQSAAAFSAWVHLQWYSNGHYSRNETTWGFMTYGVLDNTWHSPDDRVFILLEKATAGNADSVRNQEDE